MCVMIIRVSCIFFFGIFLFFHFSEIEYWRKQEIIPCSVWLPRKIEEEKKYNYEFEAFDSFFI